jgi:hypothetical protein
MGEIRAFSEEHVPDVAGLYLRAMRGRPGPAGTALQDYFREIFFTNPWVSPEIPPLVYFDRGSVVGFLGVIPRVMEFRGRIIRVATVSQFMVERKQYRGPAAIELLQRFFKGPQDLSCTDGAAEESHIVWRAAGGHGAHLYSFHWLRALRPVQTVRNFVDRTTGTLRLLAEASLGAAAPVDALLARLPGPFRVPRSTYISSPVSSEDLLRTIREVGWREPLKPSYEAPSFGWLMSQTAATRSRGDLCMTAVRAADGSLCGWHVYYAKRGGPATVLQIGVRRRDQFDGVFAALLRDAWEWGSSSVKGQAMPQFLVNLTQQFCLFRQATTCVLFQSRNPDLTDTIFRGRAALTGLDGERWLDFPGACGDSGARR